MRRRTITGYSLAILMMAFVHTGWGQNEPPTHDLTKLSLEDLMRIEVASVFAASKFEQRVTNAPASVSIITAEEITAFGHRTLADVLRSVRGFYISNDRNYSYAGIRGFARPGDYNTRLLLLIDGHRLNENIYDAAYLGTEFQLDVDIIDRVEVIRGPGSSLYGTSAFFGVINVITKKGTSLAGTETVVDVASNRTYKTRVTFGGSPAEGVDLLLSGTLYNSKGHSSLFYTEFNSPLTNNGLAINSDADRFKSAFASFTWNTVNITGLYSWRKKYIPTAAYGTVFNDAKTYTIDGSGYVDVGLDHDFNDVASLHARVFYDNYEYDGEYSYMVPVDSVEIPVNNVDGADGHWWGSEIFLRTSPFAHHTVTIGGEARVNTRQSQRNFDVEPLVVYTDASMTSHNLGFYLQDEIVVLDNLLVNVGIRHDYYSTFGGTTNPRLGVVYSPFSTTTVKALYGSAFRAPNAYEMYYYDSPRLKPEVIRTGELVVEHYLGDHYRFAGSGFLSRIENLITQTTKPLDDETRFVNAADISSRGLELEAHARWAFGVEALLSFTHQRTYHQGTHQILSNSPSNIFKANVRAPLIRDVLQAGLEVQHTGARLTIRGEPVDLNTIANVTLSTPRPLGGVNASVSMYNLFDTKYGDPGNEEHVQRTIEQDGRAFRLRIGYAF